MDTDLVKTIGEMGQGSASILAFAFVIYLQMKLFSRITDILSENTKNLIMNTEATKEMKEVLKDMNGAIATCKYNKKT